MSNQYGPWATAIHVGSNPQLSAFWKRRLTMLVPASQTSPVLSRRSLLWLGAAGALTGVLPTFRPAQVVGEEKKLPLADKADTVTTRLDAAKASLEKMNQLGEALLSYESVHHELPPAYSRGPADMPLLSWRVLLLPYVNQKELYNQFHLDEPWDSEHNRKLIIRIPAVYRTPKSNAALGKTSYLALRGQRTVLPEKGAIHLWDIKDGMSNTIWLVEVSDALAVEWTRPEDFRPDPEEPTKGLVGLQRRGFLATLVDGTAMYIPVPIDREVFDAIVMRDDGRGTDWPAEVRPLQYPRRRSPRGPTPKTSTK